MKIYRRIKSVIREGGLRLLLKKAWRRVRVDYSDYFAHQTTRGLPVTRLTAQTYAARPEDVAIANRLIPAFRRALADEKRYRPQKSYADAWDDNRGAYHGALYELLTSGDSAALAAHLVNVHRESATYGVSGSSTEYGVLVHDRRLKAQMGTMIKDALVSFAEALAILPYETVVPQVAKKNIYADADHLAEEIERRLGISIFLPEIDGGLYKIRLKNGSLDCRDLWSLYLAWRVKGAASVAEIGPGLGKAAVYAKRFGVQRYSLFDLPLLNVIQGWYLLKAGQNVSLYGEADSDDSIKVMPYWEFPQGKYGMVVNQDSFPEIHRAVVESYLAKIKQCTPLFLSINHEHQAPLFPGATERNLVVPMLVDSVGGFERLYRAPFWLRKGYVEELYQISERTAPHHDPGR